MNIRVLSVDLDGTLISDAKYYPEYISEECIDRLKIFCQKGGRVIISTGREPIESTKVFDYLVGRGFTSRDIPFIVSLNGSLILKTDENCRPISRKIFDADLSSKIISFLNDRKFNFFLINSKNEYFSRPTFFSFCI